MSLASIRNVVRIVYFILSTVHYIALIPRIREVAAPFSPSTAPGRRMLQNRVETLISSHAEFEITN